MLLILAWACGERRTRPISMPGATASAPNLARPVTLSTPSGRFGLVPTTLNLRVWDSVLSMGSSPPHFGGRIHHGAHDLVIAGAAAEVARERETHLGLGRLGIVVEQRLGGDQEARGADAALQSGVLDELLLQGMQLLAVGYALDGA